MGVVVHHDGGVGQSIQSVMARAPWTPCTGAVAVLEQTFTGVALDAFATRGEKRANCTHLHDLAVLAAAHAFDREPLVYDIVVSDPIKESRRAQLHRNGTLRLSWTIVGGCIVEPALLRGTALDKLRPWIDSLDREGQEEARLLRWGTMVANGRTMSLERQPGDDWMLAGNCYTFQPRKMGQIRRVGAIRDFSDGTAQPLERRPLAALEQQPTTVSIRDPASHTYAGRRTP